MRSPRWAFVLSTVVLSCGGSPRPKAPVAEAKPRAPLVQVRAPLTPVEAPIELLAVARVANPGKMADTAAAWSGLPIDWRHLLAHEAPAFERVFVTGASLDFAAMLDPSSLLQPRLLYAFSFGVTSASAAASFFRDQGGSVVETGDEAYRVRIGKDLVCLAGPARGAVPARVVCSDEPEGVDALSPYMTRGLPTETIAESDIHAHVLAEPLRRRYGSQVKLVKTVGVPQLLRELSLDDPSFDRALGETLHALADEVVALARDVNRLDVDVSLAPSGHDVSFGAKFAFVGQESTIAKATAHTAGLSEPAPELFWRLPADAPAATFWNRVDPELCRPVAVSVRTLLDAWLAHHKLARKTRTVLVEALEGVLTASPHVAVASLPPEPGPPSPSTSDTAEFLKEAVSGQLMVVDAGGDRIVAFLSGLASAFGDKAFRASLVKDKIVFADEMPTVKARAPRATSKLPKGTRVFEIEAPASKAVPDRTRGAATAQAKEKEKAPPFRLLIVAVPDAKVHWFASGMDEKTLASRILDARSGKAPGLGGRAGLAPLRDLPVLGAGYTSLVAVADRFAAATGFGRAALSALPHRGETPLLWRATAAAEGPALRVEGTLSRESVEDIVVLLASRFRPDRH